MSEQYPKEERRHDWKVNDLWTSMAQIKPQIANIQTLVEAHEALLYGYKDRHGTYFPGIAGVTQWLRTYVPRAVGVIIVMLMANFFVPSDIRDSLFKLVIGSMFK